MKNFNMAAKKTHFIGFGGPFVLLLIIFGLFK